MPQFSLTFVVVGPEELFTMSFVPGYEHDVFVSYASVDNKPPVGVDRGWVSTLISELERVLAEELGRSGTANVWMDHQLAANNVLTPTITAAIEKSATLLVILTTGYLESDWCDRECGAFLNKVGKITAQGMGRIFLVEKRPIDWGDKPEEIREIKGAQFWVTESGETHILGDPTPLASERSFYRRVNCLAHDVANQLKNMAEAGAEANSVPSSDSGSVLLADVTDDLVDKREEVKRYLEQQGIGVIDQFYSSDPDELRAQLQSDLESSTVFVQLLSGVRGQVRPGAENGYPCLRFEIARHHGAKILQWHSTKLDVESVSERSQMELLLGQTVISEPFEQFKSRAADLAKKKPEPEKSLRTEPLVFLNYSHDDEELGLKIKDWVEQQEIGYMLPVTSGRPEDNREALKTNVQESDAMMIFHGAATESWVRGQLLQFRKLAGGKRKGLAVFEGPPSDKQSIGMKLPGMQILDCKNETDWSQLQSFLSEYATVPVDD